MNDSISEQYFGFSDLQSLYDEKYPDDLNPKTKLLTNKKHRKVERKPDMELLRKFNEFLYNEWEDNIWYSPSDFDDIFGINRHLARYYLLNMVYEKKLFRVKYLNKTFFIKRYAKYNDIPADSKFREYIWMQVELLIR